MSFVPPNAPAQARRANDVRLPTETRSRRCLQPACWTTSLITTQSYSPTNAPAGGGNKRCQGCAPKHAVGKPNIGVAQDENSATPNATASSVKVWRFIFQSLGFLGTDSFPTRAFGKIASRRSP